jgi:hypothetical protein
MDWPVLAAIAALGIPGIAVAAIAVAVVAVARRRHSAPRAHPGPES